MKILWICVPFGKFTVPLRLGLMYLETVPKADNDQFYYCPIQNLSKFKTDRRNRAIKNVSFVRLLTSITALYRGDDKFLARPGRKQANISVRMA